MPCCHTASQSDQDQHCANHPVASWGKFDVGAEGMEGTGLRTLYEDKGREPEGYSGY